MKKRTGKTSRMLLKASLEMLKGKKVVVYAGTVKETRRHIGIVARTLTSMGISAHIRAATINLNETDGAMFFLDFHSREQDMRLNGLKISKMFYDNSCTIDSFTGYYDFLSNFYLCKVHLTDDNMEYPSAEHAYQAAKTADVSERHEIQYAALPGLAKKLGRKVILRSDWDKVKLGIMRALLISKFQNKYLFDILLNTGDTVLIEGNHWGDDFWGVCTQSGQNHLGELLMELRDDAREIL